jgi:protein O-mannosyl-transferase
MRKRKSERAAQRTAKTIATPIRLYALLLACVTLILYSPVHRFGFIVNYDDYDYIVRNAHINSGLSWQGVWWALSSTEQANWHPVTWLSHALDCQLFGLDAGWHHITSMLLHVASAVLLFYLLEKATGAVTRSFVVVALFAWHPFNVQSVAWVAERKNVLCTLFFFLTLGIYAWYVRQPKLMRLFAVAGIFALALASKPMAVSLPFALLLLDYWPLQRVAGWIEPSTRLAIPQRSVAYLLIEKLPLFALATASSAITLWAQSKGGAIRPLHNFSLGTRLENAAYCYLMYLCKTFWPFGFSVLYPHPGTTLSFRKPIVALLVLGIISVGVWLQRSSQPSLIVGWLWFLGCLVPVIGIVQVGDQAMADRYAYLPTIGLFVMAAWGANELFGILGASAAQRYAITAVALVTVVILTFREIPHWENSNTIWSHALQVTDGNLQVEKQLASALVMQGDDEEAMPHFVNIAKVNPNDIDAHLGLGSCYASQGQLDDAIREYETVLQLTSRDDLTANDQWARFSAELSVGFAYAQLKDYPRAISSFRAADQFNPAVVDSTIDTFRATFNSTPSDIDLLRLALLLHAKGRETDASALLAQGIKVHPDYVDSPKLLRYLDTSSIGSFPITR